MSTPQIGLVFRNGQVPRQGSDKAMRRLWDSILYGKAGELPVTYEDGLLSFGWNSRRLSIRPLSEDFGVFCEIFLEDIYCLDGMGSVDSVVDLGGHIGPFVSRLAPIAKHVITVEPNPDNLEARLRDAGAISIRRHPNCGPPGDGSRFRPWSRIFEASRSTKAPELM